MALPPATPLSARTPRGHGPRQDGTPQSFAGSGAALKGGRSGTSNSLQRPETTTTTGLTTGLTTTWRSRVTANFPARVGGVAATGGFLGLASPSPPQDPGVEWSRFEHRRHRMQPPDQFDEALKKFDKFGDLSFMAKSLDRDAGESSIDRLLTNRRPVEEDLDSQRLKDDLVSSRGEVSTTVDADLGLRKAKFFAGCLRADRSLDALQLPPTSAAMRASMTAGGCSSGEDSPTRSRTNLQTSGASMWDGREGPAPTLKESMGGYMSSCKVARIHPSSTGIVRPEEGKLKLEYGYVSDQQAEAMMPTLRASSSEVKEASFRSNGLSSKGAAFLLRALPKALESIDFSQNDLSQSDSWCAGFKRLGSLRVLALADCQIGDGACRSLCEALGGCVMLRSINLSGNNICHAGGAIGTLVRHQKMLTHLDLHWNQITGESAKELTRGLLENAQAGGVLRDVDLAWNPLGKLCADESASTLAQLFRETKALVHLDISKCELTASSCKLLAEGLTENKTILGMHVVGNEATVTHDGFLVPMKAVDTSAGAAAPGAALGGAAAGAPPSGAAPGAAADSADTGGRKAPTKKAEELVNRSTSADHQQGSCCWVCEGWREIRFSYDPGASGPDAEDVWVFTSLDGFQQPTKLSKRGSELIAYMMAPAGQLQYVFQVGEELLPSRMAPIMEAASLLQPPVRIRRTGLRPKPPPSAGGDPEAEEAEAAVDAEVEVPLVNRRIVAARRPQEPVCVAMVPRTQILKNDACRPEAWELESSLFAPYDEPLVRRHFCDKSFDIDWKLSRLSSVVRNEQDRAQVKELLRSQYAELKVLFSSLCSAEWALALRTRAERQADGRPLLFGVGLNEFTHMLVQHNLLGEELGLEDADALFMASAAPAKDAMKSDQTECRLLLRHDFFELLVRLAVRLAGGKTGSSKAFAVSKALEKILNRHIMYPYPAMKYNFNAVQWRVEILHSEAVEGVLRRHCKETLDPLFAAFSSSEGSASGRCIDPEGWFALLDALEAFPYREGAGDPIALWDRVWLWESSSISHLEELESCAHLRLSFVEFLEALARLVALRRSRAKVAQGTPEEFERWDYGLGEVSAATIFRADKDGVNDRDAFSRHLDAFLSSPQVRRIVRERPRSVH